MNRSDLYGIPIDDPGSAQLLINEDYGIRLAKISPDGRHIAYTANPRGIPEIFVRTFPDMTSPSQISRGGGYEAIWSPDGTELFYREENELRAVSIDNQPDRVQVIEDRLLFDASSYIDDNNYRPTYDISPDGDRFIMIKPVNTGAGALSDQSSLVVVENWFKDLERLAPAWNE